jgi:hypothetical protein
MTKLQSSLDKSWGQRHLPDSFTVVTPLPAALPLFATSLGVWGLMAWRRKRKAEAMAAVYSKKGPTRLVAFSAGGDGVRKF